MAKHFSYAQVGSYFAESLGQDHPDDTELLDVARKLNDSQRVICLLSALVVSIHKNTSTLQKLEGRLNLIETQTAQTNQSTKELVVLAKIDVQKRIDEIMNDQGLGPRMPVQMKPTQSAAPVKAEPTPKPVEPSPPEKDPFQKVVQTLGCVDGTPLVKLPYHRLLALGSRAYRVLASSKFRYRHQITRESLLELYDCGPKIAQTILDWLDGKPQSKTTKRAKSTASKAAKKPTKKKVPKKQAANAKPAQRRGK